VTASTGRRRAKYWVLCSQREVKDFYCRSDCHFAFERMYLSAWRISIGFWAMYF